MSAPAVQLVRLDVGGEVGWAARTQVGDAPLRVGLDDLLRLSLSEARAAVESAGAAADLGGTLLPPVDTQEVWGAGVTYEQSRAGRVEESTEGGIYDRVYLAQRPEVFFKATAQRVVGDGQPVGIRADSPWNAPEPELEEIPRLLRHLLLVLRPALGEVQDPVRHNGNVPAQRETRLEWSASLAV